MDSEFADMMGFWGFAGNLEVVMESGPPEVLQRYLLGVQDVSSDGRIDEREKLEWLNLRSSGLVRCNRGNARFESDSNLTAPLILKNMAGQDPSNS